MLARKKYVWNELDLILVGADGSRGAGDPHPEPSHVQQQTEELQAGDREARERLCKYFNFFLNLF